MLPIKMNGYYTFTQVLNKCSPEIIIHTWFYHHYVLSYIIHLWKTILQKNITCKLVLNKSKQSLRYSLDCLLLLDIMVHADRERLGKKKKTRSKIQSSIVSWSVFMEKDAGDHGLDLWEIREDSYLSSALERAWS